jgi:hypothetical protein
MMKGVLEPSYIYPIGCSSKPDTPVVITKREKSTMETNTTARDESPDLNGGCARDGRVATSGQAKRQGQ